MAAYPIQIQSNTFVNKTEWKRSDKFDQMSESESSAWTDGDETLESDTTASSLRSLKQKRGSGFVRILREFKTKYLLGILYLGSLWLKLPYFARDFTKYELFLMA